MSNKDIVILETNREQLNKLERDDLYDLCIENRIFKLLSENEYIDLILSHKERLKERDSRKGPHIRLPVLIITQIFRYYWILCTQPYRALTFDGPSGYPLAFRLLSLNKQFFGIVSQWFNRIQSIPLRTTCFDRPWCPLKKIVKLEISDLKILDSRNISVASKVFQSVEKLSIIGTFQLYKYSRSFLLYSDLSSSTLESLSILAPNLVSFQPYSVKLELEHFEILASFPNLVKVNFEHQSNDEFIKQSIPLFLEKPMVKFLVPKFSKIYLSEMGKYETFRNSIQELGQISSFKKEDTPKGFNFPMLKKLYFCHKQCSKEKLYNILDYLDHTTIENINHIGLNICQVRDILYPIISKMKRLQVIEDHSFALLRDNEKLNQFISELEQYCETMQTLIVISLIPNKLDKYKLYRRSTYNGYFRKFYYNKINK